MSGKRVELSGEQMVEWLVVAWLRGADAAMPYGEIRPSSDEGWTEQAREESERLLKRIGLL